MKIRTGFVSNSSSSSFVVATKENKKDFKIKVELDLSGLVDEVIETEKQWLKYCQDGFCADNVQEILDDDYYGPRYTAGLAEIKAGKKLLVGSCSNESSEDEDGLELYIFNNGLKKGLDKHKFKVIQDPQH